MAKVAQKTPKHETAAPDDLFGGVTSIQTFLEGNNDRITASWSDSEYTLNWRTEAPSEKVQEILQRGDSEPSSIAVKTDWRIKLTIENGPGEDAPTFVTLQGGHHHFRRNGKWDALDEHGDVNLALDPYELEQFFEAMHRIEAKYREMIR